MEDNSLISFVKRVPWWAWLVIVAALATVVVLMGFAQVDYSTEKTEYQIDGYAHNECAIAFSSDFSGLTLRLIGATPDSASLNPTFRGNVLTFSLTENNTGRARRFTFEVEGNSRWFSVPLESSGKVMKVDVVQLPRPDFDIVYAPVDSHRVVCRVDSVGGKRLYGMTDSRGEITIPVDFDSLMYLTSNIIKVYSDGRCGLLTNDGGHVLPVDYVAIKPLSGTNLVAMKDASDRWGLFQVNNGKTVADCQYKSIKAPFRSANLLVSLPGSDKVGTIDLKGRQRIPAEYDSLVYIGAHKFMSLRDNLYGVVDTAGHEIVEPCFTRGNAGSGFCRLLSLKQNILYLSEPDETIKLCNLDAEVTYCPETKQIVVFDGQYTVYSRPNAKKPVLEMPDCHAYTFSCGLAPICDFESSRWGYISPSGERVINPEYLSASSFSRQRAVVKAKHPEGEFYYVLIDSVGNHLTEEKYIDIILPDHGDFFPVSTLKGWGYIDRNGAPACKLSYTRTYPFSGGLGRAETRDDFVVQLNKEMEVVNKYSRKTSD